MEKKESERQLLFWSVIVPALLLLTLVVGWSNGSATRLPLAVAAITTALASWFWGKQGLASSALIVAVIVLVYAPILTSEQCVWSAGFAASCVIVGWVATLTRQEAEMLIASWQLEAKRHLITLWQLDEKLQSAEQQHQDERGSFERDVAFLTDALTLGKERLKAMEKLRRLECEEAQLLTSRCKALSDELDALRSASPVLCHQALELTIQEREQELLIEKEKRQQQAQEFEEKELVFKTLLHESKEVQQYLETAARPKNKKRLGKSAESSEVKKLKATCRQLKEQLKAKEASLVDTRHALFRMQERLNHARSGDSSPPGKKPLTSSA